MWPTLRAHWPICRSVEEEKPWSPTAIDARLSLDVGPRPQIYGECVCPERTCNLATSMGSDGWVYGSQSRLRFARDRIRRTLKSSSGLLLQRFRVLRCGLDSREAGR